MKALISAIHALIGPDAAAELGKLNVAEILKSILVSLAVAVVQAVAARLGLPAPNPATVAGAVGPLAALAVSLLHRLADGPVRLVR